MIARVASGYDNNPAGESAFVGIPQPVGISDGDLVLVAIALSKSGVEITAPDDSWSRVFRTDKSQGVCVAVYWKTAMNEPGEWVFALSEEADAEGAVVAYSGADGYEPVESYAAALTASAAAHDFPSVSTSTSDEMLAMFLAADEQITYDAAPGGFSVATQRAQAGTTTDGTVCIQDRLQGPPGRQAGGSVSFTGAASAAAAIVVVLAPSPGTLTLAQVRELVINALPKGVRRIYDLTPTGDYFRFFTVIAQLLRVFAFDAIDLLRIEKYFRLARYLLPDWENAFGIAGTTVARVGTVPQRQAQVVSSWRAVAGLGSTIPTIRGVLGPILGYDDTTHAEVLGASRSALDVLHRYSPEDLLSIANGSSGSYQFRTVDGGKVSTAGARVTLEYATGAGDFTVTLTAPDGTSKTWEVTLDGQALDLLWGAELAGARIWPGLWTLTVENTTGGLLEVIPSVIVEGVCVDRNDRQNTGAAIFHWGVYADPAHLGESGVPADFDAARRAIRGINFAHTIGNLIQSKEPWPGVDSGEHAAICGECIPCAN